jgi:hypothetical protein
MEEVIKLQHKDAEITLNEIITLEIEQYIVKSLQSAYLSIDRLYHDPKHKILLCKIGDEVLPYIKRSAIAIFLKKYSSEIGGIYINEELNTIKNCHHISIENLNCVITFNHTNRKKELPRKAIFRDNLIFDRQMRMDQVSENLVLLHEPKVYIMVTHGGHNELGFINIGIPNSTGKTWEASRLIELKQFEKTDILQEVEQEEELLVSLLEEEKFE